MNLNTHLKKIDQGISVITAIKNRRETFEVALRTWIDCNQVDEIIIVDWSSDESLKPLIDKYQNGKITLAIAGDQPKWVLSHAYNLAARLSSKSKILKLDADVKIFSDFFDKHPLEPGIFFTGNWKIARNDNEKHLNGIVYIYRDDFFKVNGYNEFIKTYGWDDIDLYDRLEALPLIRKNLNPDTLLHIEHLNRISFQNQMDFLLNINDTEKSLLNSLVNRFLSTSFKKWSVNEQMLSFFVRQEETHLVYCDQNMEDTNIVPPEIMTWCESMAMVERFYELGAGLSRELLLELNREELITLLILFYTAQKSPQDLKLLNLIRKFHKKHESIRENISVGPELPDLEISTDNKPDYPRKVNLGEQVGAYYGSHRSGWAYAFSALADLHVPHGIHLDAFIERTFHWHPKGISTYHEPWIGFIHVPPLVPGWFAHEVSNDAIFSLNEWKESYKYCKGLFTLSKYHQRILQSRLNIPVNSLLHPTEEPERKWSWTGFQENRDKKVVQIGFWLRKLYAIHVLKAGVYQKVFLRKKDSDIDHLLEEELKYGAHHHQVTDEALKSVQNIEFLSNEDYDDLLTANIVFVDLYDASANNTIIECIVRGTPVLVNPIEAVVEYLGEEYPFYFNDLTEASLKLSNMDLIRKTHQYLQDLPIKKKLTPGFFLQSFVESPIYKSL